MQVALAVTACVWEYLGFGIAWQYGAPAPAGAPVCTVTSG